MNVEKVYAEDQSLYECSAFYLATYDGVCIGSLKVSKWNGSSTLPIKELFGIDCRSLPFYHDELPVWHIGRLAVSQKHNPTGIALLKQLLTLAIYSICQHSTEGIMVAECDSKLLKILKLLGIEVRALGPGIEYLGSETIPVYSTVGWLSCFLKNNAYIEQFKGLVPAYSYATKRTRSVDHMAYVVRQPLRSIGSDNYKILIRDI